MYAANIKEGLGSSDPIETPEIEILIGVYNSFHSVYIADVFDGTNTEWDGERGTFSVIYSVLKNEAGNGVMENKRVRLDNPLLLIRRSVFPTSLSLC